MVRLYWNEDMPAASHQHEHLRDNDAKGGLVQLPYDFPECHGMQEKKKGSKRDLTAGANKSPF